MNRLKPTDDAVFEDLGKALDRVLGAWFAVDDMLGDESDLPCAVEWTDEDRANMAHARNLLKQVEQHIMRVWDRIRKERADANDNGLGG